MSNLRSNIKAKFDALKAKGLASTVSVVSQTTIFDPDTMSSTVTERAQNVAAVFNNVQKASVDGVILSNGLEFIIAGASLSTPPAAGDVIRHKGVDYKIVQVIETAPAGIPLVYNVEVER